MNSVTEITKSPQFVEVLNHFFLTNESKNYNLLHFYDLNSEFLISNTHQWDVKSVWKKRFYEVSKGLDITIVNDAPEPDWEKIKRLVFEFTSKNFTAERVLNKKKRKIDDLESSSTSTSNSSIIKNLTPFNYGALSVAFNKLVDSKKWELEAGVFAEDLLYEYAKSKKSENLSHSFVLNVKDSQLKDKFGKHWQIILDTQFKPLPPIPTDLVSYLSDISNLKSFKDIDSLRNYCYNEEKDLHVSTACLRLVASAYRNGFFSRHKILEDDILINIWVIVDQVINSYGLQAKRSEPSSIASAARKNRDSAIEDMRRNKVGRKDDLIISSYGGLELGCGEAGLDSEEFDTKVIVESSLKTPKTMHDMLVRMCGSVHHNQEAIKELQVVGLVFSRFKLRLLVMDCPKGYVFRLRGTTSVAFSGKKESLTNEFSKVYQLLWKAKEICKKTEEIVEKYTNAVEVDFELEGENSNHCKIHLPDSLQSPKRL